LQLRVDGRTFNMQNRSSKDSLSSNPDRLYGPNEVLAGLHGLYNSNERFYPVPQSDGDRPSVLISDHKNIVSTQ